MPAFDIRYPSILFCLLASACSGNGGGALPAGQLGNGGSASGGAPVATASGGNVGTQNSVTAGGTTSSSGGTTSTITAPSSGATGPVSGGSPSGGAVNSGTSGAGAASTTSAGGTVSTGGMKAIGGTVSTGGSSTSGGTPSTGGSKATVGGTPSTGGFKAAGGTQSNTGGTRNTGGTQNIAGSTASLHSSGTYATAGAWHGYIWPAIESGAALDPANMTTITPTAAQGFPSGGPPFCISGHVPATPNSLAVAMVGMNTNQSQSGGAVAAQWTAIGTGILVNVSNPGGSPLRLQIQTNETGAIATLWCAMLTVFDQNVVVPWSQFNTRCFSSNSGTYYDQSVGISTVMVLVPGTAQAGGYDFNFCVNDLAPV